jgi:photoactive yellow protein
MTVPYLKYFSIEGADILRVIDAMPDKEFHALPFGAVKLDPDAIIVRYNKTEGEITGRDHQAVIGKNFFRDLAACGVGPHFWGRFKTGILKPEYDEVFPYVFYSEMPEQAMLVRMALSRVVGGPKAMWVFVRRLMPRPD